MIENTSNDVRQDLVASSGTATIRYTMYLPNKNLGANTKTIEDMITSHREIADYLQRMKDRGVVLDEKSDLSNPDVLDDDAILVTTDPAVAEEFDFDPERWDEDPEEVDDQERASIVSVLVTGYRNGKEVRILID